MLPTIGSRLIWGLVLFAASNLAITGTAALVQDSKAEANPESSPETAAKIAQWITQLGDTEYPTREKAQESLRRLGTAAFDELLAAQDHSDVEVAQRARYLVRSIPVAWSLETDPVEVKSFLTNFGELSRNERKTRAQHLATLRNGIGIEPLCRIVRFEPDRVLSKQAALLIMSQTLSEDSVQRQQRAELVRKNVTHSKRPAVEWLLTYCHELEDPNSTLAEWERMTRAELATLAKTPQQTDRTVVRDLLRWQTKLLLNRSRSQEALVNFRRTYDLIDDEPTDIYEVIDWAIENKLYAAPDEIAARFATRIQYEYRLLYRVAEAQMKRGDSAGAERTASDARKINPAKYVDHLAAGELLYRRGLVDWSILEYRGVLADVKVDSEEGMEAREELSKKLFDVGRELEASDTVQPLVEIAEKNQKDAKNNEAIQQINAYFLANMHYWRAVHFAKLGDRDKQIEHLSKAIESAPTNPDILIAMFRVPNSDDKWKLDVQKRIDNYLSTIRSRISKFEEIVRRQPNFEGAAGEQLAQAYNEMAWLIGNTSGNAQEAQEAVRASQRSLELSPSNEAYLDTLGRCHFAAGDLEQAVQFQRRAVEAAPYVHVMQRQLKEFEQALADSKTKAK